VDIVYWAGYENSPTDRPEPSSSATGEGVRLRMCGRPPKRFAQIVLPVRLVNEHAPGRHRGV
jgi:hypothetical protein